MLRYVRAGSGSSDPEVLVASGVDLIISAGQSNDLCFSSTDAVNTIDPVLDWSHDRIFQWSMDGGEDLVERDASGAIVTDGDDNPVYDTSDKAAYANVPLKAVEPLRGPRDTTNWSIGYGPSPAMRLARSLLFRTPANRLIVIVPTGVPGSGLVGGGWDPDTGELFANAVAAANAATDYFLSRGIEVRTRLVYFAQGENEAQNTGVTPSTYGTGYDAVLEGFRAQVTNAEDAILLCAQMVPEWIEADDGTEQRAAIDQVHRLAPNRLANCWFVHGKRDAFKTGDKIHYNANGGRTIGDRAFQKYVSALAYAGGAPFTAPTDVEVLGTRFSWIDPPSDAPAFAIDYRDDGSSDEYTRIICSPPDYYEPGDRVSYTFTDLTGDIEVIVAAIANGVPGPFSEPQTVTWQDVEDPFIVIDTENAVLSGSAIVSIPGIGTNTDDWFSTSGKEPLIDTYRGRKVIKTEAVNSFLETTASLPDGDYTLQLVVKSIDFAATLGTFLSSATASNDFLLWRNGTTSPALPHGGQSGAGAVTVGTPMAAGVWTALTLRLNLTTGRQTLFQDGVQVDDAPATTRNPATGMVLNALTNAGSNGNHAYYAGGRLAWTSALTDAEITQEAVIALAAIGE